MDVRLKERLIGAAVLVAVGVWIIPWVLDGGQAPPAAVPSEPLDLPAPGEIAPVRTETLRLDAAPEESLVRPAVPVAPAPAETTVATGKEPVRVAPRVNVETAPVADAPAAEAPLAEAPAAAVPTVGTAVPPTPADAVWRMSAL